VLEWKARAMVKNDGKCERSRNLRRLVFTSIFIYRWYANEQVVDFKNSALVIVSVKGGQTRATL